MRTYIHDDKNYIDCYLDIPQKFTLKKTERTGLGLFATGKINEGDCILQFTGKLITHDECEKLRNPCNPVQIEKRWNDSKSYINLEPPGVYVNHSCRPNCGVRDGIFLFAIADIDEGEELTFDYSTTCDDNFRMFCKCGCRECRRVVYDFQFLSEELQQKYTSMGIVSPYIAEYFCRTTKEKLQQCCISGGYVVDEAC